MIKPTDRVIVGHETDCDGKPYPWRSVYYFCPGCRQVHRADLNENGRKRPAWTWNGDAERPLIEPSVHYTGYCHHNVEGDVIRFANDSPAHELRGSHPLPMIQDWPAGTRAYYAPSTES